MYNTILDTEAKTSKLVKDNTTMNVQSTEFDTEMESDNLIINIFENDDSIMSDSKTESDKLVIAFSKIALKNIKSDIQIELYDLVINTQEINMESIRSKKKTNNLFKDNPKITDKTNSITEDSTDTKLSTTIKIICLEQEYNNAENDKYSTKISSTKKNNSNTYESMKTDVDNITEPATSTKNKLDELSDEEYKKTSNTKDIKSNKKFRTKSYIRSSSFYV